MLPALNLPNRNSDAADACWARIGVQGDRTCPRLAEAVHCRNCPVFAAAGQQLLERAAPPGYLAEQTAQFAEADAATAIETQSVLVFRIAAEWLALDVRALIEVVEPRTIHRVPHRSDRLFLGLANIRGELQLCISLCELLGIEADGDSSLDMAACKERLLVADLDGNRWVFPVDSVEGVHRIPTDALTNLPDTLERSQKFFSQALFTHGEKRVGLLSEKRLSQALERTIR
jgi:chemotaxis-related protein WspD